MNAYVAALALDPMRGACIALALVIVFVVIRLATRPPNPW